VQVDETNRKMQKKVREAQLEQWNYILVVGDGEKTNGTVNIRTRDNVVGRYYSPRHIVRHVDAVRPAMNSRFLCNTESFDVPSDICQTL
jgi:threonyl-tRNA synthetase